MQPGMAQSFGACLQPSTLNEFSVPLGHWIVSWPSGIWGQIHLPEKLVVSLAGHLQTSREGNRGGLRSVSHLGEGFLEGVEKERREGRRRGKRTDSKC